MNTTLRQRFYNSTAYHPGDTLELVQGDMTDYQALKQHHYRADRPATATRVLALRGRSDSALHRYAGAEMRTFTAAVLVESLPSLSCKMRNWALADRYGTWLPVRQRAMLVNKEVRVISRVIVHPSWRGLGLAVRLVRAALDSPATIYTEALAAMGRVNPFFEHGGMTAYPRPPHACDSRLIDALQTVGLPATHLAMLDTAYEKIETLPPDLRYWICKELHRWYRSAGGRSTSHSRDPRVHLQAARARLTLDPVYYLHHNTNIKTKS